MTDTLTRETEGFAALVARSTEAENVQRSVALLRQLLSPTPMSRHQRELVEECSRIVVDHLERIQSTYARADEMYQQWVNDAEEAMADDDHAPMWEDDAMDSRVEYGAPWQTLGTAGFWG